ncbi:aminotransferase [Aureococcus anophagefferens]|nr:aminotransferase [Aureococcus anophagefferens]
MLVETLLRIAVGVSALGNPRGLPRSLTEALTSDLAPARFAKDFSKPLAVPEAGIEAAVRAMRSGRLFRYGASSAASSEVARARVRQTADSMLNGGEAGFATTDDAETAAKLVYLSGCYERRYGKHGARPEDDDLLERAMATMPYLSTRMSELSAACLRPAVASLADRVVEANRRHALIARSLADLAGGGVVLPEADPRASCVGDRLTFSVPALDEAANGFFRTTCVALGVPVAWLKSPASAFHHGNWRNYGAPTFDLPGTDAPRDDLALPALLRRRRPAPRRGDRRLACACAAAASEDDGGGA